MGNWVVCAIPRHDRPEHPTVVAFEVRRRAHRSCDGPATAGQRHETRLHGRPPQVLVFLRVGTPSKDGAPVARMAIGYAHEMEENAATEVYTLLAVESAQRPVHVWGPAKRIVGAKQAKRSSWFHVIPVHWILGTVIVTATQSDGHGRGVAPATLSGAR